MENNVKFYRLLKGLNQTELGLLCGLSQNSISSIERGEFNPMLITANDIANALDCSIFELFYLDGHAEQFYYLLKSSRSDDIAKRESPVKG